jgi:hypothetical protein
VPTARDKHRRQEKHTSAPDQNVHIGLYKNGDKEAHPYQKPLLPSPLPFIIIEAVFDLKYKKIITLNDNKSKLAPQEFY